MDKVNVFINQISGFNKAELKQISERLLQMLKSASGAAFGCSYSVDECRKCGSKHLVRFGKDKNGKQRYKCSACGATFTGTSFSVISHSHCSEDTWEKYIGLLLDSAPLTRCAKECKISVRTAFIWRHKILNALQKDQDNRVLAGIVEADEMFVHVSYKGNHTKSKRFTMPREPFERGSDNRDNFSPKVCLVFAVERNGQCYGEAVGVGHPTLKMLSHAFNDRICPESIMITDKGHVMKNYFRKRQDIEFIRLESSVTGRHDGGPPEIRGAYHIQHVNNAHHRFRDFLRRYCGVSTKYLNHYVGLFIWIENHKNIELVNLADEMKRCMVSNGTYQKANSLFDFPSVPCVA